MNIPCLLSCFLLLLVWTSCREKSGMVGKKSKSAEVLSEDTLTKQSGEFVVHRNGLIYDEGKMERLRGLVDSLHLRFKTCEPKTYFALPQGLATAVVAKNTRAARAALRSNITPAEFKRRFPFASVQPDHWVVKERYKTDDGKSYISYTSHHFDDPFYETCSATPEFDKSKGWIIFDNGKDGLSALYLEGFTKPRLPSRYAMLVQYVDCMVDTTADIFIGDRNKEQLGKLAEGSSLEAFSNLVDNYPGAPVRPKPVEPGTDSGSAYNHSWYVFEKAYEASRDVRIASLDKKMRDPVNRKLMLAASEEAIARNLNWGELEFYVERYLSAMQALRLKRSHKVVGFCSMDASPRIHAREICRLAAKAGQWDIFVRAHLNIMNDNFERASDGFYAHGQRKTYLPELEALGINTPDLLVGSCLSAANPSVRHYNSNRSRVGSALAESRNNTISKFLSEMASDSSLDLHNRMELTWLLYNYLTHLHDQALIQETKADFFRTIDQLPLGLAGAFRRSIENLPE